MSGQPPQKESSFPDPPRPALKQKLEQIPPKQAIKQPAEKQAVMSQHQYVAFSPIRNPVNRDRVFIYRIAPKEHTLSYEQRAIQKGISAPRWNKNPTANDGVPSTVLRADSNIVALVFDDVVRNSPNKPLYPEKWKTQGVDHSSLTVLCDPHRCKYMVCAQVQV